MTSWAGRLSPASYVAAVRERVLVVFEDASSITGFGQLNQASGAIEAVYVLPDRQREGIGNLCWSAIGIWAHSYAMVIANLGFFSMNVRGFIKWAPPEASST